MAKIISASIDLSKINKKKIVAHKNGGKYYSIQITLNDEKDKYDNDVSIAEGQTKEEREKKEKKIYIGNGKTVWSKEPESSKAEIIEPAQGEDGLAF